MARASPGADRAALRARLDRGVDAAGHGLDETARERLVDYVLLLARWNSAYNLTAVRDPGEMVARHVLDSLSVLPWVEGSRLLDIGTGAGLPGLVIAVARPRLSCDLLDSVGKKTRFCRQAADALGLDNARAIQARAEALRGAERWDTVVSRATVDLRRLWSMAAPLLGPGGRVLAMKGRRPDAEIEALGDPGVSLEVVALDVPGLIGARHLVTMRRSASA